MTNTPTAPDDPLHGLRGKYATRGPSSEDMRAIARAEERLREDAGR
jgi:hypothetical protein